MAYDTSAWEAVIGLEVHCQLLTKSKIFSGAATQYGAAPNTQADAVTLGLPGVLPVLNATALEMAVKFGLAVDAQIAERCVFARKHYFYPDLPKGYQITQYELPIVAGGKLDIELPDGSTKTIGITRAHMEEDAGKSLHENFVGVTGIDLNRAGTPLIEIVSEPEIRSAAEAVAYLKRIAVLDIFVIAGLYSIRIQGGAYAVDVPVSALMTPPLVVPETIRLDPLLALDDALLDVDLPRSDLVQVGQLVVSAPRRVGGAEDEQRDRVALGLRVHGAAPAAPPVIDQRSQQSEDRRRRPHRQARPRPAPPSPPGAAGPGPLPLPAPGPPLPLPWAGAASAASNSAVIDARSASSSHVDAIPSTATRRTRHSIQSEPARERP